MFISLAKNLILIIMMKISHFLNNIVSDFENLNLKIKKIPKPIKELLDRKWEKEPNTKESLDGSTKLCQKTY
jgi:hypothetical protein